MYKEEKSYLNERNRRRQLQRHRKKRKIWNTAVTLTLSALLFGTVAGSSGYAVEQYLVKKRDETTTAQNTSSDTDTTVLSLSATTTSSTDQLSVTEIAASGLSSVVSVTNISVQEVENYFGGHGETETDSFLLHRQKKP